MPITNPGPCSSGGQSESAGHQCDRLHRRVTDLCLSGISPCGGRLMPFSLLRTALAEIRDPRRPQGRRYALAPLLLFSVLAVLAGATSYQGIITFIDVHRERLNAIFGAHFRRAPAINTLRNLFLALDPADALHCQKGDLSKPPRPATLCWSASSATSRAFMTRWSPCATRNSRSTA